MAAEVIGIEEGTTRDLAIMIMQVSPHPHQSNEQQAQIHFLSNSLGLDLHPLPANYARQQSSPQVHELLC